LFVEDAFDHALIVKGFLSAAGRFDVTHSQDGDSAAALIQDESWDLFVADLNLPGKDGFELIRMCRERHPDVPVLATTGYTATHYHEAAFRAGANDLMTKPLEKEEFLLRVSRLVDDPERAKASEEQGEEEEEELSVLALGGLVGDAEMGCGGSLRGWVARGRVVYVVPVCLDERDTTGAGLKGARDAAAVLGLTPVIDEDAMASPDKRVELVRQLVLEHDPELIYVPAARDQHPARSEAFRIAKEAASSIPTVLAYQTATSPLDFRPGRFADLSGVMQKKMAALTAYMEAGARRPDLAPPMAQVYARYWGRLKGFTEVEAFAVLKGR
jgi:CheY-like chemotaxis protein